MQRKHYTAIGLFGEIGNDKCCDLDLSEHVWQLTPYVPVLGSITCKCLGPSKTPPMIPKQATSIAMIANQDMDTRGPSFALPVPSDHVDAFLRDLSSFMWWIHIPSKNPMKYGEARTSVEGNNLD